MVMSETEKARRLRASLGYWAVYRVEPEPVSVQVVERIGLVASNFQETLNQEVNYPLQ